MSKKPRNFEYYKKLVDILPGIECKGKTTGYTSLNGNMFTFLSKDGELGIRLSKDDQEEFKKKYNAEEFVQYGSVMQDYVKVPEDMIKESKKLKPYLKKSLKYVKTLPKKH